MPFSVWLTVPFRSLLSIDSERALAHPAQTSSVFRSAVQTLEARGLGRDIQSPWLRDREDYRFQSLDQAGETPFSSPVLEIGLSLALPDTAIPGAGIADARLKIYENMICILVMKVAFDPARLDESWKAGDFENALSALAEAAVRPLHNAYVTPVIEALIAAGGHGHRLVKKTSFFRSDADLRAHEWPLWNGAVSPFLWASRLYCLEDWEGAHRGVFDRISRAPHILENGTRVGKDIVIMEGTCLVARRELAGIFLAANSIVQYFYCLFDSLNRVQSRFYQEIGGPDDHANLQEASEKFGRVQTLIAYVQNELGDVVVASQGTQKKCILAMSEVFGISELIAVIEKRSRLLGEKISREIQNRRIVQEKLFQALLFVLGATGIYEAVSGIYSYASGLSGPPPDGVPGILDLLPSVPFDLALDVITALILLGAAAILFKKAE